LDVSPGETAGNFPRSIPAAGLGARRVLAVDNPRFRGKVGRRIGAGSALHPRTMNLPLLRNLAIAASLAAAPLLRAEDRADFNQVGRQMAIMLQNSHYAQLPFDEALGRRFLDDYLEDLDSQKSYFTREDIARFRKAYGNSMHRLLLEGKAMDAAVEIYETYRTRVRKRVGEVAGILAGDPDFSADEKVMLSRKDAPWPENDADAARQWKLQIKEAVLAETLRRENIAKLAKEQGKSDPAVDDRSPKDKVALRYKRLLASIEDADREEIANYFLSSVARSYDPHSEYMSHREMERFRDGMKNELVGIGALLEAEEDGATKITGLVVGGPADLQGSLGLNDRVVAVDTLNSGRPEDMTDVMFMRLDKVVDLIRGKEGTSVGLKVEPASGATGVTRVVVIKRGKVELKDEQASGELIETRDAAGMARRMGVIKLPSFYADFDKGEVSCSVDVERILGRLIAAKIDGLVLDLRGNGGGSLEEVRRMTGFFLERGPVVQVKDTMGRVQTKDSDNGKPLYTGPMVVMTDRSSASASEILAGALQDFNRAVLVGDSATFGKGTVQQPLDIGRMLPLFSSRERAGFLKVTIQKFYRPSGSSTQLDGVASDIVLPGIFDAIEVGEEHTDNPLPHDRIGMARGFRPLPADNLFLPALKERSGERVRACRDFSYTIEDAVEAKRRMMANELSLDIAERRKEMADADAKQKARNAERRARFAKVTAQDKGRFKFFRITLDGLEDGGALEPFDPSAEEADYMRRAKNKEEDLDDTPKWPTGLDPVKRESLAVLGDLVELTGRARMAGVIK
jgi:carboxyl-terminal processing protease